MPSPCAPNISKQYQHCFSPRFLITASNAKTNFLDVLRPPWPCLTCLRPVCHQATIQRIYSQPSICNQLLDLLAAIDTVRNIHFISHIFPQIPTFCMFISHRETIRETMWTMMLHDAPCQSAKIWSDTAAPPDPP